MGVQDLAPAVAPWHKRQLAGWRGSASVGAGRPIRPKRDGQIRLAKVAGRFCLVGHRSAACRNECLAAP